MKKHILLAVTLILLLLASTAEARKAVNEERKNAKMYVCGTRRKEVSAVIRINTDRPFIVGRSIYVLYIGNRHFDQSEEDLNYPLGHSRRFYIPVSEYNKLEKGAKMHLTYGYIYEDNIKEDAIKELCEQNHIKCWSLGKFHKKRL
jgi:hypothetical protein